MSDNELHSNVCKFAFSGTQLKNMMKNSETMSKTTTKASIPYKRPYDLYSAAVHIAPIPTFHSCGPGFPRHHPPFSASHPLLCVTLLLRYVLFLNQSNVVILYPAEEEGGASLRHHAKGTMSEMKNEGSKVSVDTNQRDPSSKTRPEG